MCCNNTFKCPPSEVCNCDNPAPGPTPPDPPTPPPAPPNPPPPPVPPTPTPPGPPAPPPTPPPGPPGTKCNPGAHPPENCPCSASCTCCTAKVCACRHVCPKTGYCPANPGPAPPPRPPPPAPGDTWSCEAAGTPFAFCGTVAKGQFPTKAACNASCHGTPAPPPPPGQQCNPKAKPPQNCPCDDKTCKCCASPTCSCRHTCPNCGKPSCFCPPVGNRTRNSALNSDV